jgi:hypothetical protein
MARCSRSPEEPPAGAAHALGSVRLAGFLLLAGAALALFASFLPLGQATFPPEGGDPGATVITIPARPLLVLAQIPNGLLGAPFPLVELIGLWGLPLALAALGTSALVAPRRRRTRKSANVAVTLACVGLFYYALYCLVFVALNRFLGPAYASISFGVGPFVAGAGYFCAIAGADGSPSPVRGRAQSHTR